jgi:hypothetical protein
LLRASRQLAWRRKVRREDCLGVASLEGMPLISSDHPTLELHKRILAELDHREAAVGEQEALARQTLAQVLAHCAAERASIDQDRAVLVQADSLCRRFIETNGSEYSEINASEAGQAPEPVREPEPAPEVERAQEEPAPREFSSVMALRRTLWKENQLDEIAQRTAWRVGEPPSTAPHCPD